MGVRKRKNLALIGRYPLLRRESKNSVFQGFFIEKVAVRKINVCFITDY